jgi:hypothetical protein
MRKNPTVKLDDKDIIAMAKGAGAKLPDGFIEEVLEKAKEIDRDFEREKKKAREDKSKGKSADD